MTSEHDYDDFQLSHYEHIGQLMKLESCGMANVQEHMSEIDRIGYYRLSGYWDLLRETDPVTHIRSDQFIKGARFEDVLRLYRYDNRLRTTLYSVLSKFEMLLRASLGKTLARRDPLAYLKPEMLRDDLDTSRYSSLLSSIQHEISQRQEEDSRGPYSGDMSIEIEDMSIEIVAQTISLDNLIALCNCAKRRRLRSHRR